VQSGAIPLIVADQAPGPTLANWTVVQRCPACGSSGHATRALLPDTHYMFGAERVLFPAQGIWVIECGDCGLYYKATVPSPSFLKEVFERQAASKWKAPTRPSVQAASLREWRAGGTCDLLDVGAAGGALLGAFAGRGVQGRRSALDVMRYPGIEVHLAGEFIEGFIDDPLPAWSCEPYDLVTVFDVLEHLYRPRSAFENLRLLVKPGGRVFVETGNPASEWPRHFGIGEWWYVRLLEHHIFWSQRSLQRIAADFGFTLVEWRIVRHKSRRGLVRSGLPADLLKMGLYWAAPKYYSAIANVFGKQGNQPWDPFARDHFQACLQRT
jgi:SAM-dependent methyltransferase